MVKGQRLGGKTTELCRFKCCTLICKSVVLTRTWIPPTISYISDVHDIKWLLKEVHELGPPCTLFITNLWWNDEVTGLYQRKSATSQAHSELIGQTPLVRAFSSLMKEAVHWHIFWHNLCALRTWHSAEQCLCAALSQSTTPNGISQTLKCFLQNASLSTPNLSSEIHNQLYSLTLQHLKCICHMDDVHTKWVTMLSSFTCTYVYGQSN